MIKYEHLLITCEEQETSSHTSGCLWEFSLSALLLTIFLTGAPTPIPWHTHTTLPEGTSIITALRGSETTWMTYKKCRRGFREGGRMTFLHICPQKGFKFGYPKGRRVGGREGRELGVMKEVLGKGGEKRLANTRKIYFNMVALWQRTLFAPWFYLSSECKKKKSRQMECGGMRSGVAGYPLQRK